MNLRLLSLVFAAAIIITSMMMLLHMPQSAILDDGFNSPIIAFEFARDANDVAFLSGPKQAAVAARQGMVNGLALDMLFPFAYAGYLLILLFQSQPARRLKRFGTCVFASIVVFDIFENLAMLQIIDAARAEQFFPALFVNLYIATWLKWMTIAVSVILLAARYYAQRRWLLFVSALPFCVLTPISLLMSSPAYLVEPMALSLSVFMAITFIDQLRQVINDFRQIKPNR